MDIQISRALPAEYPVILNNMPKEWFEPEPHLIHLQVAEMVSANRFLIAHAKDELIGALGWQDNVAFGAFYEKFLFVKAQYRRHGVAAMLWRELATIAADSGQRAIFADVPDGSPLARAVRQVPGSREVGYIDGFHSDGVRSHIFALDVKNLKEFDQYSERVIKAAKEFPDFT